jgi:hypothetical protein
MQHQIYCCNIHMEHMQHTSETLETYGCNMCSSTCCPQWTLVDAELDAGMELEIAHCRQADGSRPQREARGTGTHGTARGTGEGGGARHGAGRPVLSGKDGHPEGIIIVGLGNVEAQYCGLLLLVLGFMLCE